MKTSNIVFLKTNRLSRQHEDANTAATLPNPWNSASEERYQRAGIREASKEFLIHKFLGRRFGFVDCSDCGILSRECLGVDFGREDAKEMDGKGGDEKT